MSRTVWLYVLLCRDDLLYVGIAQDVEVRFQKHLDGTGSFFTRLNKPLAIIGAQAFPNRADARDAEIALKKCTHQQKLEWAAAWSWQ
jgi:putative endonuclease